MILVDTSVWIEFFKGTGSKHHLILHDLIENEEDICLTDIIITEILQGISSDKSFNQTKRSLLEFPIFGLKDTNSYIEAAKIYRTCRKRGYTVSKPIDCLISQVAIENNLILFHNDKDFNQIARTFNELQILKI